MRKERQIVGSLQSAVSKFKWTALLAIFIFCQLPTANCQSVSATLRADSNHIQIGDPLNMRLTVKYSKELQIAFPKAADTLGNMETISVSKIDTGAEGNNIVLSQLYTVSAYDSGEFHAGPVMVYFRNSLGQLDSVPSDDILVAVGAPAVDLEKPFKAIKAPLEVPYSWREFIPYIVGFIVLLIAIIVGIVLYNKYANNKPVVVERPKPKDPAHIWARKELKKLEEEKLWQNDNVKQYYSRLTDILRMYLEYRYNWFALESTTEEIESEMPQFNMKEKAKENLLSILRVADLVKFAKMIPAPDANIRAMESAYKFIDFTEPNENKTEEKK